MNKELEFECGRCWESKKGKHFKFKTNDWLPLVRIDDDGETYINIEASCPKCDYYCYQLYYLNSLLEMIFELQEEIKSLRQKIRPKDE